MGSSFRHAKRFIQSSRSFHSNGRVSPETIVTPQLPSDGRMVSIYRVPNNMRQVETKAYDPNIVSIGPYHHGLARLQSMEHVKRKSLDRILDLHREHGVTQDTLFDAVKSLEDKVRACYSDQSSLTLGSDEFVQTLVTDGCFVLDLFRESLKQTGTYDPIFTTRWMLPVLRRDLIMLENQIPFFVLSRLFDLMHHSDTSNPALSLVDLTMNFFNPLMPRHKEILNKCIAMSKDLPPSEHLLGLFRSSFLPKSNIICDKDQHVFRSVKELREAGVKIRKMGNSGTLDTCFRRGVLRIPPLFIDDYTGTLLRNMLAFEQCHQTSTPDFTSFLFFVNGLINIPEDVERLHYARVIQHSLGSDGEVADFFNKLCREVARDTHQSYLRPLSKDLTKFCNRKLNKWKADLRHEYFSTPWAMISLLSALVFLALTASQTYLSWKMYQIMEREENKANSVNTIKG